MFVKQQRGTILMEALSEHFFFQLVNIKLIANQNLPYFNVILHWCGH